MKNLAFHSLCIMTVSIFAGCASPLATYKTVSGPDTDGLTKFRFSESVIQFSYRKEGQPVQKITGIDIVSVPIPHGDQKYSVRGASALENYGVTTTLNVAYRNDTDLIQTVSSEVTDQKVTWITTAGGIVAKAAPFLVADEPITSTQPLPTGIVLSTFLMSTPTGCKTQAKGAVSCSNVALEGTKAYVADIDISGMPDDAFEISSQQFADGYKSSSLIYSACREMNIRLKNSQAGSSGAASGGIVAQATLQVADPSKYEALRFPDKGTVTVGSSCGASVQSQSAQLPGVLEYADALIGQATAVKKALDTSKSSGAK